MILRLYSLPPAKPINKPLVRYRPVQSWPMFFSRLDASLNEKLSRGEHFNSRYAENNDHISVKWPASLNGHKPPQYYISLASFSSCFPCPLFPMLKFDEKSVKLSQI